MGHYSSVGDNNSCIIELCSALLCSTMVISYSSVLEVMTVLSEEKELRVTVTESGKGALLTGGVAGLGGLLLGPLGLALGGAVGGCIAAWRAHGNFKPVMEVVLYDLQQDQRDRMVESVRTVLANIGGLVEVLVVMLSGETKTDISRCE